MAKPKGLDKLGLRHKRHYPTLPADQQRALIDFLAYYRAVAETGQAKAAELAALATEDLGMRQTAEWWAYCVRSIDWLLSFVDKRQMYLEIQLAMKEGRWQGTGSGPVT